jgi:hypothetical protein
MVEIFHESQKVKGLLTFPRKSNFYLLFIYFSLQFYLKGKNKCIRSPCCLRVSVCPTFQFLNMLTDFQESM